MNKRILLTYLCFIACLNMYGQTPLPTPNTASLGIFNQFPQSSFVGQPAIDVPIYNISYDGLQVDVMLKYNTNLLKPYNKNSWVGKGWSLSCGGVITRIVNDKPDDMSWCERISVTETNVQNVGYYYNANYLSTDDWTSAERLKNAAKDSEQFRKKNQYPIYNNIWDYSPDEFNFNVGNISGSFFLDHNKRWKVRCDRAIKVEIVDADFASVIVGGVYPNIRRLERIKLTDDDGIVYIFGGAINAYEYETYDKTIISWYLTKILALNGSEINFDYEAGPAIKQSVPISYYNPPVGSGYQGNAGITYKTTNSNSVFLKTISTDLENVVFQRHDDQDLTKLDVIEVFNKSNNSSLKKFNFQYLNETRGFKLQDLNVSNGGEVLNLAAFEYYPGIYTGSNIDHWGYYTESRVNSSSKEAFMASKRADFINNKIGVLKRIKYPTGGYTEYEWEGNSIGKILPLNKLLPPTVYNELFPVAGGIRIHRVTNFSNDISSGSKTYYYLNDFDPKAVIRSGSSGVLYSDPSYDYRSPDYFQYTTRMPMTDSEGSHITYSSVVEVDANGGYTITKFSNYDTGIDNEYLDEQRLNVESNAGSYATEAQNFISNRHERGRPLNIKTYSSNGILISEKELYYKRIWKTNEFVRAYKMQRVPTGPEFYTAEAIKIYTNSYRISKINDTVYNSVGTNPVHSSKEFEYDSISKNLVSEQSTDSQNKTLRRNLKYPFGISSAFPYNEMIDRNILTPLIVEETTLNGVTISTNKTNYGKFDINGLYLPKSLEIGYGINEPKITTVFDEYDLKGNLLQSHRVNGITTSYVYGYSNQHLIAELKNTNISLVRAMLGGKENIASFSQSQPTSEAEVNSFLSPLRSASMPNDVLVTTYTVEPFIGLRSITNTRGQKASYEYDSFNRLKNIKDLKGNIIKNFYYHYKN